MRGHERVQPGYGDVRDITSRWLVIETGRTIENANVGLRELARRIGVSASMISQIENGKSQPSVATLYSLERNLRS